jgi:sarcosine oxidase subunit delta
MKIMPCPLNGPRNITEFSCFGEVTDMPEPNAADDATWAEHVWFANNTAGVVREWWCHMPTNYWFIAERHTVSDEIVRTYPATEVFNRRIDFASKDGGA